MTDSFNRLMGGLASALAHAQGNPPEGTRVHVPETLDVAAIRERTGLTQPAFAATIGVSVGTLRNWEQRRRAPEGPARVLLALVERRPHIVAEVLKTNQHQRPPSQVKGAPSEIKFAPIAQPWATDEFRHPLISDVVVLGTIH